MSIGGWSGSDDNVTLAQFEQYVKNGDITYFIAGGGMGGGQGGNGVEGECDEEELLAAEPIGEPPEDECAEYGAADVE